MKKFISILVSICMLLCLVPTTAFAETEGANVDNALNAITTATQIPHHYEFELEQGQLYEYDDEFFYADFVKLSLKKGEKILMTFSLLDEDGDYGDTEIWMFDKDIGGDWIKTENWDNDNYCDCGNINLFVPEADGDYYFAFKGYSQSGNDVYDNIEVGTGTVDIIKYDGLTDDEFDFCDEDAPAQDESGLWNWNAQTKTLTLKDGFELLYDGYDSLIKLPDGSTVVTEGTAKIYSIYADDSAIYCDGEVTIKGNGTEGSNLYVYCDVYAIYATDKVTVKDIAVQFYSYYGIVTDAADIVIEDSDFAFYGSEAALRIYPIDGELLPTDSDNSRVGFEGNIIIMNSNVDIHSDDNDAIGNKCPYGIISINESFVKIITGDDEGIYTRSEDGVNIKDSFVDILTDEEGIYCSDNYEKRGDVTIDGGRLEIVSKHYEAIQANKVFFKNDVEVDLEVEDEGREELIWLEDSDGLYIPKTLKFFDIDGELIYTGEWNDSIITYDDENRDIIIDDTEITHIVTVHEHSYGDWSIDSDNHWHECMSKFCPDSEASVKDKAAHTSVDDGDCTTAVLCAVCGKETVAAKSSHTFGEWKYNGDGTHTRYCTNEGCAVKQTEKCTGKDVCAVCNGAYGESYKKSPNTGDNATGFAQLALFGVLALSAVVFGKKK